MAGTLAITRRALAIALILLMPPVLVAYLGEQGIPGFPWASLARIGWPYSLWAGAALGMIGALAWSALLRDRADDRLHAWADLIVRRTLTLVFLSYGLSKLFRLQFYEPYFHWQETPVGDLSGFELTWYFFGASFAYSIFIGLGEISAALLLLARRTSNIGALLLMVVGGNILAVNIAYGIGVAHFAGLILAGAVYILLCDATRLIAFFFGSGATPPRADPHPSGPARAIVLGTAIVAVLLPIADKVRDVPRGLPVSMALTGAWRITADGAPPIQSARRIGSALEWQRISFEKNFGGNQVAVWTRDSLVRGRFQADTAMRTLRIHLRDTRDTPAFEGTWELRSDSVALLRGLAGADSVTLHLRRTRVP
jgi:hypothetical protein